MLEVIKILYGIKCFRICFVIYFVISVVQAEHSCEVIVIERVVQRDVNNLARKYHPVRVLLPDLGTEFWILSPEYRRAIAWNTHPLVEIGPGAFKAEVSERPTEKLVKGLKFLLNVKKKKQENKKDVNEGREPDKK